MSQRTVFGCPFAYLQQMVDAKELPTWVLNAINEEMEECMEENVKLKEEKKVLLQDWQDMTEEANKLDRENKELKLERERDTIAEVRSARDRAMSENKKLKAKFEKFKEVLTQE